MDYRFQIDCQFLLLLVVIQVQVGQVFIDLDFVAYPCPFLGYWGGLVVDHHVLAYLEAFLLSTYLEAFHRVAYLVAYHLFDWGSYHLSLVVVHHLCPYLADHL